MESAVNVMDKVVKAKMNMTEEEAKEMNENPESAKIKEE